MPAPICLNCKESFKKKDYRQIFCSHSCAAKTNNRLFPKRKLAKNKFCKCGKRKSGRAKICLKCIQKRKKKRTLENVFQDGGAGVDKWVRIRQDARQKMEEWKVEKKCVSCGWNKHTHVIHVKPISSFNQNTLLIIVNARKNLKRLCPNCHWLFDNGQLKI